MTRFHQCLYHFDLIIHHYLFTQAPILLIFNDIRRFKEKVQISPLRNYFPDYEGGADGAAACDHILNRFVCLNKDTRKIYAHFAI